MATQDPTTSTSTAEPIGLHRLPAPHDRVEFRIQQHSVQYSGSAEDLISAGVVSRQMVTDKTGRIYARGNHTRRDAAGGKIHVRYLKYEVVVDFFDALDAGLTLPGVTDELLTAAAAKAEAIAECQRSYRRMDEAPAEEEAPESITDLLHTAAALLKSLASVAMDFENSFGRKILERVGAIDRLIAAEREQPLAKRRPSYLRLVIDNDNTVQS
jgi:hypothetical protein